MQNPSGADYYTDHGLLIAKLKAQLCTKKKTTALIRYDLSNNKFDTPNLTEADTDSLWLEACNKIKQTAEQ